MKSVFEIVGAAVVYTGGAAFALFILLFAARSIRLSAEEWSLMIDYLKNKSEFKAWRKKENKDRNHG